MDGDLPPSLIAEFPESIRSPAFAAGLREAVGHLSARGLVQATRWAAELLAALPAHDSDCEVDEEAAAGEAAPCACTPALPRSLVVAKTYFDTRQYRRCAAHLERARAALTEPAQERPAAKFLRCFSVYLCTEKGAAMDGAASPATATRVEAELRNLRADLAGSDDPHCRYLHAVVLEKLELSAEDATVRALLVQSVTVFPWNWAAWRRLAMAVSNADEARAVVEAVCARDSEPGAEEGCDRLGRRTMSVLFWAWSCLENDSAEEARDVYAVVAGILHRSVHLKGCLATALYHLRLFDEAQEVFEAVFAQDEYNLDGVDTYSNILYVKEDKVRLSVLAQRCVKVDKYCVETCCVVGNYYSLRGQHEQAVSYFQRALKLNPSYLSAWTLMGHEYVEMKNTAAAVEAYRRAVDVSPKDFRAWYGLGQTYELLDMPLYTLYYYGKAAALRPRDARMWSAVGQTYEELGRHADAVRAYERANACDERGEGQALGQLATLYGRMAEEMVDKRQEHVALAVHYHEQDLARRDGEGFGGAKTAVALRFLADHAMSERHYGRAERYLLRLLDYAGHKDAAKTMLREVKVQRGMTRDAAVASPSTPAERRARREPP
jgi:anaphase-promoting complex subunit 8